MEFYPLDATGLSEHICSPPPPPPPKKKKKIKFMNNIFFNIKIVGGGKK